MYATKIEVEGRKYCAKWIGLKPQSEAIAICQTINARLPLPKSSIETDAFAKRFPYPIWLDITDPVKDRNRQQLKFLKLV